MNKPHDKSARIPPPDGPTDTTELDRTHEAPDESEVIYIDGGEDRDDAVNADLKPVIDLRGNNRYADFHTHGDKQGSGFEDAVNRSRKIIDRVRRIPSGAQNDIPALRQFSVLAWVWTRGGARVEIGRQWPKGYGYVADRISEPASEVLHDLHLLGLVDRELAEVGHACPKCESLIILLRDSCLECGSLDIRDETLIHHFRCGYQGPETSFSEEDHLYRCPKCRQLLHHLGLDYDKPGVATVCGPHDHVHAESVVTGRCVSCDHRFKAEDSPRTELYDYKVTPRGEEVVLTGKSHLDDPGRILSGWFSLVPIGVFISLARKYDSLGARQSFETVVFRFRLNPEASVLQEDPARVREVLRELASELETRIRDEDAVAFSDSALLLMLAGMNPEELDDVKTTLTERLQEKFDSIHQGLISIEVLPVQTFLEDH